MDELTPEEVESLSEAMDDTAPTETPPEETSNQEEASPQDPSPQEDAPKEEGEGSSPNISHAQFMQLDSSESAEELPMQPIERMYDVKVKVEVILGKTKMTLQELLRLQGNSVIELNKLAGEHVDVVANGELIAKAEVVVIEDNFGIKIVEIAGTRQKLGTL